MFYWTPKRLRELKEKGLKLTYEDKTKKPKKLTTTIPPKSGPQSQGLNIDYNTVKEVRSEKNYGNRQKPAKQKG
jgi:hypothetical protein|tara:strand:+ start:1012 stop:1233 length:222 start_codon:yes stop_codon:yes gene_type:complete